MTPGEAGRRAASQAEPIQKFILAVAQLQADIKQQKILKK